jgi:hypothetical protein
MTLILALLRPACGQVCPLRPLNAPAIDLIIQSEVVFDDQNTGMPRLYILGSVSRHGIIQSGSLFRWTGTDWEAVPGAPAFAGGVVLQREGGRDVMYVPVNQTSSTEFYRFDGTAWTTIAPLDTFSGNLSSLVSFDPDGEGPAPARLYANVGRFQDLSHVTHEYGTTYVFDGAAWTQLGATNLAGQLTVFQPEVGPFAHTPQLYLSGAETWCTEDPWSGTWNCSSTNALQQLVGGQWNTVLSQNPYFRCEFDPDGPGPLPPVLCTLGSYTTPEGTATSIGAFDGVNITGIAPGLSGVTSLVTFDPDGSGPSAPLLLAGGTFQRAAGAPADGIAAWNGSTWAPFAGSVTPAPGTAFGGVGLTTIPDLGPTASPTLLVGARPALVEGRLSAGLLTWRDGAWSGFFDAPAGPIYSLTPFTDGAGPALFAAGAFLACGDLTVNNIVRWNGQRWDGLGAGIEPVAAQPNPQVFATAVYNDGSGTKLYAAGTFASAGGVPLRNIARWTGTQWERVGSYGLSGGYVFALTVHDPDGSGPLPARLYAGGAFTFADGTPVSHLAYWDGAAWNGVPGIAQPAPTGVRALRSWDDGSGPALWVGGDPMSVAGLPDNLAFKLTSAGWQALPSLGVSGYPLTGYRVNAFALHDLGGGLHIYAIGQHGLGISARLVNNAWFAGPGPLFGLPEAFAGCSADDGRGPAAFISDLRYADYASSTLNYDPYGAVRAMTQVYDDGNGPAIFFAGEFVSLRGPNYTSVAAGHIARLPVCSACYANCDNSVLPPVLNVADFTCFVTRFAAGDEWANCDQSTAPPVLNVLDFTCFLQKFAAGCSAP